jgi:Mrp family chromosome partitioning ATPase
MSADRGRPGGNSTLERQPVQPVRDVRLVEQYRALRAVIEAAGHKEAATSSGQNALVVLVVGIDHGVSDVGIRLAAAFADGGRSTLLVDADIQAQGRHRLLRPEGQTPIGIVEWLSSESETLPLPAYPAGLPNLTVLPAGGSSYTRDDLLASDRLAGLVQLIRAERERAVVIAPPLGQAADALFLAPHVDGVVLVVAPGKTGGPAAIRARDGLLATGARLYGVVLGEAEPR